MSNSRHYRVLLAALLLMNYVAPGFCQGATMPIKQAYLDLQALARASSGEGDQSAKVSKAYRENFALAWSGLDELASDDLHTLFLAASEADFYAPNLEHLADMRRIFLALEQRKQSTPDEIETLYGALFQARAFDELKRFQEAHPSSSLAAPPRLEPTPLADAPHGLMDVAANEKLLSYRAIDLATGKHIVVIAHPLCHFSQGATATIEADPGLAAVFKKHATWVAPPDRGVDITAFQQWKSQHHDTPIAIAYSTLAWPEVDVWQTPVFLFFDNGKLVSKMIGWPREGNMPELKAQIEKLGL